MSYSKANQVQHYVENNIFKSKRFIWCSERDESMVITFVSLKNTPKVTKNFIDWLIGNNYEYTIEFPEDGPGYISYVVKV